MKAAILLIGVFLISVHGRGITEPVRTPQMNRIYDGPSERIVGGYEADIANFPHMLAMLLNNNFRCGASNIGTLFALSAAHCLDNNQAATAVTFRGGSTSRLSGGFIFLVSSYVLHPEYNRNTLNNDVMFLRINPSTPLVGVNVVPVALPPNCAANLACCQVCTGVDVTVSGWGIMEGNVLPVNLRYITQAVHDLADCHRIWGGMNGGPWFCKEAGGGRDSCNGDSGSPLVRTIAGTTVQVGVVSFGSSVCGDGSGPSGNARIEWPGIRDWIRTNTGL